MHKTGIVDGATLRSVLKKVYKHFGTQQEAAKALGISQPTFTRLLNGRTRKRIGVDTYQNIREGLRDKVQDPVLVEQFERSVLTRDGWHVQQQYNTWLHGEINRRVMVLTVFLKLWEHPDYKPLFEKFLKLFTGQPGLPPQREKRIWVALLRAVEPLGAAEETWGVERSWQQIHEKDQLEAFLRHSLNREAIMLDRDRDLKRLSKCRPPSRYLDVLAGEDTVLDRDEIEHLKKSGVRDLE